MSKNLDAITPGKLPPAEGTPGRLRLLCVGVPVMGLKSFSAELERYCAGRNDVQAVHITMTSSTVMKALSRVPVPWDPVRRVRRMVSMWNRKNYGWFRPGGPVPIDRFDAAIVCPHMYARGLVRLKQEGHRFALSTQIDATVHNTMRDFGDAERPQRPLIKLEREVLTNSDVVSYTGSWAGNSVRDDYGVPAERLVWAPPIAPYYGARKHVERKPGALPRIVFVGYDWERKGGAELLAWHQKHLAEVAELHFIGGGEKIPPGATLKNVTVHGRVERDRLINELLPTMDFFVMPTKKEMSSWAGIEAMGHGLPVVLSAIGGIPDLVVEGETGFLAKPGDEGAFVRAMRTLIDNPDLCRRMGEAARQRVAREFTREVVFSRLIDKVIAAAALQRSAAGVPA